MLSYVARRLLALPLILLAVTFLIVLVMQLIPPEQRAAAYAVNLEQLSRVPEIIRTNHLDGSVFVQYGLWLKEAVSGNLGFSRTSGLPVLETLRTYFPATLELALFALVPLRGHWSYNNAGFFVAGRIIEVLTGQTWEQTVTERVFTPLGMDHSFFFANQIMTWRFAVGYNKIGEEFKPQRPWMMMRSAAPAGSTCSSTAVDMAKYAHYIMEGTMNPRPAPDVKAEGGQADQDAEQAEAAQPTAPAAPILASVDRHSLWATRIPIGNAFNGFPGERGQMGQSWFVDDYGHTTILSHGGTTVGHQSDFWVSPDRQVGFISLTNGSNGHALNRQLSEWVKREVLGLMAPELGSHEHDEASLADFTGVYDVVGQTYTLEVSAQDGALVVRMPDPASGGTLDLGLTFIEPERAVIADGNYAGLGVEFLRNGSGAVDFMRFGGRIYPRQVQATPDSAQPTPEVVSQV